MNLKCDIKGNKRQDIIDGIELVLSEIKSGFFGGGASRLTGDVSWQLIGDSSEKTATYFYDEGK